MELGEGGLTGGGERDVLRAPGGSFAGGSFVGGSFAGGLFVGGSFAGGLFVGGSFVSVSVSKAAVSSWISSYRDRR
jgi:hypothetical protein